VFADLYRGFIGNCSILVSLGVQYEDLLWRLTWRFVVRSRCGLCAIRPDRSHVGHELVGIFKAALKLSNTSIVGCFTAAIRREDDRSDAFEDIEVVVEIWVLE